MPSMFMLQHVASSNINLSGILELPTLVLRVGLCLVCQIYRYSEACLDIELMYCFHLHWIKLKYIYPKKNEFHESFVSST